MLPVLCLNIAVSVKDRVCLCLSNKHGILNIDVNDGDDFSTLYILSICICSVIAYNTPCLVVIKRKYTLSSYGNPDGEQIDTDNNKYQRKKFSVSVMPDDHLQQFTHMGLQ